MKARMIEKLVLPTMLLLVVAGSGCTMLSKLGGASAAKSGSNASAPSAVFAYSSSVANADNIPARIQNALTLPPAAGAPMNASLVNPNAGNFANALSQQLPNLSPTSDPAKASGAGSVPLLSYAACTDVAASNYGVSTGSSLSSQSSNLVKAGLTIVNQCTGNLAASGSAIGTQVSGVFNTLVAANVSAASTTSAAFISVCTAATSFCVGMLGF